MKNKKTIMLFAVLLIGTLLFSACTPAGESTATQMPEATSEQEALPSASPAEETPPPPAETPGESTEPEIMEPEAAVTLTLIGKITEMMDEQDQIHVVGENQDATANDVIVNLEGDAIIYDAQSERFIDDDALKVGDTVQVTISGVMTKSMPPIANGFMVITNLPENLMGLPIYTKVEEVTQNEDGSVSILNQNKDTIVTIPADMTLEVRDNDGETEANSIGPSELKQGDILLTWYDFAALSYPAQATATNAMLIVND